MKCGLTIFTCLTSGGVLFTLGSIEWKMIGATAFFFGCWLTCILVERRRINKEIDRFIAMDNRRLITGRPPSGRAGLIWQGNRSIITVLRTKPVSWTENTNRVILLDSGQRKG
ncbi:hypothetical protein HUU59_09955 [bacterium]|nr:hypothetical protein [bacterium]